MLFLALYALIFSTHGYFIALYILIWVLPRNICHHEKFVHFLEYMFQDTDIVLRDFVPFLLLLKKPRHIIYVNK